ncbi:ERF family protein [Corticibacterium sp. UT-5YL-CI-8]|nr:ERF family protein [Tianweitania sp. UT-5YL-CI-8]
MATAVQQHSGNAPVEAVSESAAIFSIIERAARDPNVDLDKMERLMAMHERMASGRAKAAFATAFAEMQPELPIIPENGKGHNSVSYALWEDVNEFIKPVLAKFGFGLSFHVRDGQSAVEITAVLSHRDGHSDTTVKSFPADTSGNKNAIQAIGSSISYGKRYTAGALLNLTSRKEDDDGHSTGKPVDATPPPAKSSASLKKAGEDGKDAWQRLIEDLQQDFLDCKTTTALSKLRADYRERARTDRWPRAWLEALSNEFDTFEEKLEAGDIFPGDR